MLTSLSITESPPDNYVSVKFYFLEQMFHIDTFMLELSMAAAITSDFPDLGHQCCHNWTPKLSQLRERIIFAKPVKKCKVIKNIHPGLKKSIHPDIFSLDKLSPLTERRAGR